jgi:hypothetical protein
MSGVLVVPAVTRMLRFSACPAVSGLHHSGMMYMVTVIRAAPDALVHLRVLGVAGFSRG